MEEPVGQAKSKDYQGKVEKLTEDESPKVDIVPNSSFLSDNEL